MNNLNNQAIQNIREVDNPKYVFYPTVQQQEGLMTTGPPNIIQYSTTLNNFTSQSSSTVNASYLVLLSKKFNRRFVPQSRIFIIIINELNLFY